ncbi:hypothetical protein JD79_00983 [Geodermatophilus normandii]|uniref:Uncharacterized protein n=1 Tax=Geodermatophilus normandii TaxID=1137989 RepID=A0A317QES4_9ACTN|nr:hypothetical protein [Geodermatophilus normandii]PWW21842.1 hypothetical protein JD79_00983 [Geodermatophilus normandii]
MTWWVWLVLVWPVLALGVAVVLGRVIRMAERRERGRSRAGEDVDGTDWDVA